jgi:uncharacterized protein (UPF0254 family)
LHRVTRDIRRKRDVYRAELSAQLLTIDERLAKRLRQPVNCALGDLKADVSLC